MPDRMPRKHRAARGSRIGRAGATSGIPLMRRPAASSGAPGPHGNAAPMNQNGVPRTGSPCATPSSSFSTHCLLIEMTDSPAADPGLRPTESVAAGMFRGMKTTAPLLVGIIPLAFILGTQGAQHGLTSIGMALMAGLNFAGGSEFAAVALWSAAPSFVVIFITTWLINCRHIVLGAALTPWMERQKLSVPKEMLAFFIMCDETWALSMQDLNRRRKAGLAAEKVFSWPFHMGVGLTLWSTWWFTAGVGAAFGGAMGDLTRWGFMMAFPATFIGLVVAMRPALKKSLPMAVSAVAAALSSLWLPLHWSILIATVLGLGTALLKHD